MQRAQLIRKLVLDSHYVIDEHLVAGAILARAALRGLVGDVAFRNDPSSPRGARPSFHPSAQARSFWPPARGRWLGGRGALHRGLM